MCSCVVSAVVDFCVKQCRQIVSSYLLDNRFIFCMSQPLLRNVVIYFITSKQSFASNLTHAESFHWWVLSMLISCTGPRPFSRQHLSNDDCLQVNREDCQNCSVQRCVHSCEQWCTCTCEQYLKLSVGLWSPYVIGQTIYNNNTNICNARSVS